MSRTRVLAIVVLAALCRGDCSSDTTECTGAEEDWLGSLLPPGFSPHSSFVKCIGATLAGSVFALVGMVIEGRKERRQEKPISREELKLPRSSPRAMSPRLEKVNSPPAEVEGSPSRLPSAEMKRSQSMPSAQLKHIGSQEWKDTPKARSDEMNWRSTNGRLPRTISAPVPQKSGKSLSEMQQVERQVKSILNKLTWEKFDKLYTDLLTYCMVDDERLRLETLEVIARDVFKKATLQHNFIELYADLCAKLDTDLREKGVEVNFRRALLEQCQESFTVHLAPPEIDTCLDYEEQYEMLVKYKTKMLGNVKLIAHLLRLRMLAAKIIFHCIEELISIGSAEDLQHPHISSLTDLMEDDKNYYIISDYYMGGDVQDWLERMDEGNWLQEATCAAYVRQALLALSHSHSAQVYHRDMKPSSLLLTTKLPDAVIKVVDFGIAHILDPDNSIIQSNPSEYTVPEVMKSSEQKGGSADMWSVGAIAHSLLVGNGTSVSSRRGWGYVKDEEGWSERSPLARDFVLRLLRPAHERPSAAKALHHPWIKGMMPINMINVNQSNSKEARELRYKMLCYTLSVILLPAVVPHRDFDQLRVAFQQSDIDRDGYVPRAIGLRLLLSRCQQNEAVVPALNIVDLGRTDTCDLAAIATADLIAREFFAAGPTSAPLMGPFTATDLAPRLLKRFFELFAEKRNGVPVATVQLNAIRAKTRTATAKDVEAYARVHYEELLSCLPEDTAIDSQLLTAQLSASAGRGTPLGTEQELSPLRADSPWELSTFLDLFGIFYTCSSSKRDDSPGSIRMY